MIPTKQDNELREAITLRLQHAYYNRHTDGIAGVYAHALSVLENYTDEIMQLITADRKRVALEARIDELEHTFVSYDNALASELVENPEWEYGQVVERIAELKAQQEEV